MTALKPKRNRFLRFETLETRLPLDGSLPGVPNVLSQFNSLEHHAEGLAFTLNEDNGAPDASISNHYQGIVRYPGAGTPEFFVTQKDPSGGYIHVVKMGSREIDGERLRSNLQRIGTITAQTAPPTSDTWIGTFRLNGFLMVRGERMRGYVHPGGMAIVDNVLFVAMDSPSTSVGLGGTGAILMFDLGVDGAKRFNPEPIKVFSLNHKIDNLAVVKQSNRYLIYANGDSGNAINLYRTTSLNLRSADLGITFAQRLDTSLTVDYQGPEWPTGASAHQSATFIRQSTSANPSASAPLYLVTTRQSGIQLNGTDLAELYRVESENSFVKLTYVNSFHATLRYSGAGTLGDFDAAGGAYVSPSGELILYATPHNDADNFSIDNVRIAEIRHRDVVRPGSPLLKPDARANGPYTVVEGDTLLLSGTGRAAVGPWVELFDDDTFNDRSLVIDYRDRSNFELNNLAGLDAFGDKASSVRWRLPVGMSVELFEDVNFRGSKRVLVGDGRVRQISDLGSFGDETSSLRFVGTNRWDTLDYTWDLDGDGVFGETGSAAAHGAEVGELAIYFANDADGPSSHPVAFRVTDGTGAYWTSYTSMTIVNAPPALTVSAPGSGLMNQTLTFQLSARDPSAEDHSAQVSYFVDFGDGTSGTYRPNIFATNNSLTLQHAYTRNGRYRFTVRATDQDGGISEYTRWIVIAPENG